MASYISSLKRTKRYATLDDAGVAFHQAEVARLRGALQAAGATSSLAEEPTARKALHDLLLRVRLGSPLADR
jgi:hypothetical protein